MSITLVLQPEIEDGLLLQAKVGGVSLAEYVEEIVVRQAHASQEPRREARTGQELIDACERVRGLLSNEEVDALFSRTPAFARPVELA